MTCCARTPTPRTVPYRQDQDIGEAFAGQRGEFLSFYQRALRSLDLYREISAAYGAL